MVIKRKKWGGTGYPGVKMLGSTDFAGLTPIWQVVDLTLPEKNRRYRNEKVHTGNIQQDHCISCFVAFFLPMTGLFLYLAVFDPSLTHEERLLFAAGAVLFGGLVVFAAYRVLYRGTGWVEYDADTVIFHCSRREQYRFRWGDVPGDTVQAGLWQGGYMFTVLTGDKQQRVGVSRFSSGFKDLEHTLEAAGVLRRIGIMTKEDFKQTAEQVFGQFDKYREAHPDSVMPKPEGDCVLCPDCNGKGLIVKRVLKLDVGKVCKTCGGSGYVPR